MKTKDFHISTTKELLATKDRVRSLISHWGEDGRYKEAILKSAIERFLPSKFNIATGFVIKQTNDRTIHEASTQIDLLIYDSSYPVLFKEGDFAIVTPDSISAIIEVKSRITQNDLTKIVKKADSNGQFIFSGRNDNKNRIFNGIFSFEGLENLRDVHQFMQKLIDGHNSLNDNLNINKYKVNHISFNKDLFLQFKNPLKPDHCSSFIFKSPDLSFSYFISCLMNYLNGGSISNNNNLWFVDEEEAKMIGCFV